MLPRAIASLFIATCASACTLISLDDLQSGIGGNGSTNASGTGSGTGSGTASTGATGSGMSCDPTNGTGGSCSLGTPEHCSRCNQDCKGGTCGCAGGTCPNLAFACGPGRIGNDIGFALQADATDVFVTSLSYLKRESKVDSASGSTTTVTQAMSPIGAFILDGADVYYGPDDSGVYRVSKMGGIPQIVVAASSQGSYRTMLRVDDELVMGTSNNNSLRRIKLPCSNLTSGCTPEVIAHTTNTRGIQADADNYYFTATGPNGTEVDRIRRDGTMIDPVLMDDQAGIGAPLALVGSDLYYVVNQSIFRIGKAEAKGSANPPKLVVDLSSTIGGPIYALSFDGCTHLYVASTSTGATTLGRVARISLDGSGPVDPVADNDTQLDGGLAIDGDGVYFAGEAGLFHVMK